MAGEEVRLGVAVVPVRVSLDELDKGLGEARAKIESALGAAWQKAGTGADALQGSMAGVADRVGGVSNSVTKLGGETQAATAKASTLGTTMREAAQSQARPAVEGLTGQVKGLASSFEDLIKMGGAALAFAGGKQLAQQWLGYGEVGAALINVERSFQRIAGASGANADAMLADMQRVTQGVMSQTELMRSYNQAVMLLGPEIAARYGEMAMMAQAASAAGMGNYQFLLDSLVRGVGRLQPLILDNLGVTADWAMVYAQAAAEMGKTAEELSMVERQTAMLNEAQRQIEETLGAMGEDSERAGLGIARLRAELTNLSDTAQKEAAPSIDRLAASIADLTPVAAAVIGPLSQLHGWWGEFIAGGEGGVDQMRGLALTVQPLGPATLAVLGFSAAMEELGQRAVKLEPVGGLLRDIVQAGTGFAEWAFPVTSAAASLLGFEVGARRTAEAMSTLKGVMLMTEEVTRGLDIQVRGAGLGFAILRNHVAPLVADLWEVAGAANSAGDALHALNTVGARDLQVSMMKFRDFSRGITKPQIEWYTHGRMPWELPQAYQEYTRDLGSWIEGEGRRLWSEHSRDIKGAGGAYNDLQQQMESYYQSWQQQSAGILAPTQQFDLDALEAELGIWTEKWDEPARRAMDVFKHGTASPWADVMGLESREEALQYMRDFYAGKLPEDVNWEAAIGVYQRQMEGMLGQQNLQGLFQEKLIGAGWGPDNATVMAALEAPFQPAGVSSAAVFADAFTGNDWTMVGQTTASAIQSGLATQLEKRDQRFTSAIEGIIIDVVRRHFFGGATP